MLHEHFGTNIGSQMVEWWRGEFLPTIETARSDGNGGLKPVATVILAPVVQHNWRLPLQYVLVRLDTSHEGTHEQDRFTGPVGLYLNVAGKLRFSLRTEQDSIFAELNPDLLLPGDFPWEGALYNYNGYTGGTSGLRKQDDAQVTMDVIQQLKKFRAAAARPFVLDSGNYRNQPNPALAKYLGADPLGGQRLVGSDKVISDGSMM